MLLAIFLGQQPTAAFGLREFCKFHGMIIVGESKLRRGIFIIASSPILVSHRSIIASAREFQNSDKFQDSRDSRGLLK